MEYPTTRKGGPLLPAFRTADLSWEQLTEVKRYLADGECSLTNGPVFNDYYTPSAEPKAALAAAPEPEVEPVRAPKEELGVRLWRMADGDALEAEFVTAVSGQAVFKNGRGRQIKVPMKQLLDDDRKLIRLAMPPSLDINFSKTTKQRTFGADYKGRASPVRGAF